jgi:hypothetical protein
MSLREPKEYVKRERRTTTREGREKREPREKPADYCIPLDYLGGAKIPKDFMSYVMSGCLSSIFAKRNFEMTILIPKTTAFLKGKSKGALSGIIRAMVLYRKYDKATLKELDGKTIASYGGPLLVEKGGDVIGGIKVDLKPIVSKEKFNIFNTEGKAMKIAKMRIDGGDLDIPELISGGGKKKKATKKKPAKKGKKTIKKKGGGFEGVGGYDPIINGLVSKTMKTIKGGDKDLSALLGADKSILKAKLDEHSDYNLRRFGYDMIASTPEFGNYRKARPSWADQVYANLLVHLHDNYPAKLLEKSGIMNYDPILGLEKLLQWKSGINTDVSYELSDPVVRGFFAGDAFDTSPDKLTRAVGILNGIGSANFIMQGGHIVVPHSIRKMFGGTHEKIKPNEIQRIVAIQHDGSIFEKKIKDFEEINEAIEKLGEKGGSLADMKKSMFLRVYDVYKKYEEVVNPAEKETSNKIYTVHYDLSKRYEIGTTEALDRTVLKKINGDLKSFLHTKLERTRKGDKSDEFIELEELSIYADDDDLGAFNLVFGDGLFNILENIPYLTPFSYGSTYIDGMGLFGGTKDSYADIMKYKQSMSDWVHSKSFLWEGNLGVILSLLGDKNDDEKLTPGDFKNALRIATKPSDTIIESATHVFNLAMGGSLLH